MFIALTADRRATFFTRERRKQDFFFIIFFFIFHFIFFMQGLTAVEIRDEDRGRNHLISPSTHRQTHTHIHTSARASAFTHTYTLSPDKLLLYLAKLLPRRYPEGTQYNNTCEFGKFLPPPPAADTRLARSLLDTIANWEKHTEAAILELFAT